MSRARHKEHESDHMARGGNLRMPKAYDAQGSEVEEEAEEKKAGGRVKKKGGGMVDGKMAHMRGDRKPRKRGGAVNMTKSPFTEANKETHAKDHDADSGSADGEHDVTEDD